MDALAIVLYGGVALVVALTIASPFVTYWWGQRDRRNP